MTKGERTFDANVKALVDELESASRWDRPSILFAVCDDFWVKTRAVLLLERKLSSMGFEEPLKLNFAQVPETSLVATIKALGPKICFAWNLLDPLDEEETISYKALNMQRETFVEGRVKMVFWLTSREASCFPGFAPDFWSFRHRVIIFNDSRSISNRSICPHLMLWWWDGDVPLDIDARKKAISAELPLYESGSKKQKEQLLVSLSRLTKLYWSIGERNRSFDLAREGLDLYDGRAVVGTEYVNLWIGMSANLYANGMYREAENVLSDLGEKAGRAPIVLSNLGDLYVCTGRKREGLELASQGVQASGHEVSSSLLYGFLLLVAGRIEDAVSWFGMELERCGDSLFGEAQGLCQIKSGRFPANRLEDFQPDGFLPAHGKHIKPADSDSLSTLAAMEKVAPSIFGSKQNLFFNPGLWVAAYPENPEDVLKGLKK